MSYTRTNWVPGETPLSAENMNNIEQGIEEIISDVTSLQNRTIVDSYFGANTSGQTHTYSLDSTCCYMLYLAKFNSAGSGVYFIAAHNSQTLIGPIINSSLATVTASGTTLSVTLDANYFRVTLIKIGGN